MMRNIPRMIVLSAALLAMSIFLADCGGGGGYGSSSGSGYGGQAPASTVEVVTCPLSGTTNVAITGSTFIPATVTIAANGVVMWTNNDGMNHTVTSTTVPAGGTFDRTLTSGASVCLKFTAGGDFHYRCTIHSGMTGTVTVN